jgi:hypothetical protein
MDPNGSGKMCRARIVKVPFESLVGLRDLNKDEVLDRVDFSDVLAFACGKELGSDK